jgi:hypothetical protein
MGQIHAEELEADQLREPPRPTHSEEGVDLTVIRMMREKSYDERLRWLQRAVEAARRLQRGRRIS